MLDTWPEAGRIYCERENVWCANVDLNYGFCKADRCDIHDPEYVRAEEEREARMQELHRKEMERQKKPQEKPVIRRQTKTKADYLQETIDHKEQIVSYFYKIAKPKKAMKVEQEVWRLEVQLKRERELLSSSQSK